ncbi:MAG: N-acetyltransferase [Pedosphaera sp.]|nr:N-acetyltransferase [Pedosphaera sp.]
MLLEGRFVRLEPLAFSQSGSLCEVGLDPGVWQWMPVKVGSRDGMHQFIGEALEEQQRGKAIPFAIIHRDSGRVVGSTRFGNVEPAHRRVEIGWTWIAKPWQRTAVNTEAKLLLLRHAFEVRGDLRVEFKTDALNERSRHAILRLGAREEGTLRQHIICSDGRVRDTVYFSMLADEWPAVKLRLGARLGFPPA